MNAKSDSNRPTQIALPPRSGRNFADCISTLIDEIQLAIRWDRPSILLVTNSSQSSREKAQRELSRGLSTVAKSILSIGPGQAWTDLFQFLAQAESPGDFIYFVEGLGRVEESYRALNLRREQIVEKKLIVLFWLTPQEAKALPAAAPDFWAFRHRVIEFSATRGPRHKAPPTGLMVWGQDHPFLLYNASLADFAAAEDLLQMLPASDDALFLRADAIYRLAGLCWLQGDTPRASALLVEQVKRLKTLDVPDLLATFLNGQAILSYDQGSYEEAAAELESALEIEGKNPVLLCNLAIAIFASGKAAQSIKLLERAIRSNPNAAWLWYILGYIQLMRVELEQAEAYFRTATRLDGEAACPRIAAVVCRARMGDSVDHAVSEYLSGQDLRGDHFHAMYLQILRDGPLESIATLRAALRDGTLSPLFLKRDPILNLLIGETLRNQLLAS